MQLFKPKAQPCQTIIDFLNQEESHIHLSNALSMMSVGFKRVGTPQRFYSPKLGRSNMVQLENHCYLISKLRMSSLKNRFAHRFPKGIDDEASTEDLLQIVENRGDDPDASFLLGIIKEYGLNESLAADPGTAEYHYEKARNSGCRMMRVLDCLRNEDYRTDLFADRGEYILNNLYYMVLDEAESSRDLEFDQVVESLTSWEKNTLKRLSNYGIAACQQKGYPFSTLMVCKCFSPYLMARVTNTEPKENPLFDESVFWRALKIDLASNAKEDLEAVISLSVNIWKRAQAGDELAAKCLEHYGVSW